MLPGLERNTVVATSARTGKTQTLTNIYLCHALRLGANRTPVPYERIAATTFSRAATAEIRERLEQRLQTLAGDGPPDALEAFTHERGLSQAELRTRAARTLHELPSALIDTLHALALR